MKKIISEEKHKEKFSSLNDKCDLQNQNNWTFLLYIIRITLSAFVLFALKSFLLAQAIAFAIFSLLVLIM